MTTTTGPHDTKLDDATAAAAGAIADRLRTKSIDQVIETGERTGWWPAELVEWVADGRQGPAPSTPPRYLTLWEEEQKRLEELQGQLADDGVIATDRQPEPPDTTPIDEWPEPDVDVAGELDAVPVHSAPSQHVTDDPAVPVAGSAYIAVLQARDLGVDHFYQRPLDEARVARMAADWNPRMLGTIDVSDRGPDQTPRYAVVNGQHRACAAARVSPAGADVWLPCTVHEGLDVAAEARLMHELDRSTKKLSGFDQWRARRGAGDPVVADVEAVCAVHGLRVDPAPADGSMRSYGSAEKLVKLGGRNLLDNTLAVLRSAYGVEHAAYQAPLLMGVGQIFHRYPEVDAGRLRNALANTRPEKLRATATALREADGGPLHELMTRTIVGQYNRTAGAGPRIDGGRA